MLNSFSVTPEFHSGLSSSLGIGHLYGLGLVLRAEQSVSLQNRFFGEPGQINLLAFIEYYIVISN